MWSSNEVNGDFEALLTHLKETRGFDFTAYKRSTLLRRVHKRITASRCESYGDYVDYLEVHQDEFLNLFNTILINVTAFFRDEPSWEYLQDEVIPRILASRQGDGVRVWCAGCASGEEAYSIAMAFAEVMGPEQFRQRVKIYATDVDDDALVTARQGIYTDRQLQPVAPELRERYFEALGDKFAFRKDFRRALIFGRHDLLQDAPISRVDLLTCRNTLMYFNSDAQARILSRYNYALREGGFLFLGKAETLLSQGNSLTPVELKHRIFTKPVSDNEARERPRGAPAIEGDTGAEQTAQMGGHLRDLAFQADPIAQLAVDAEMKLILVSDKARELFGISSRDIGRPLHDLDVSYRPLELRSLLSRLAKDKQPVTVSEVYFPSIEGKGRWFDVHLMPLLANEAVAGAKLSFVEVTREREMAEELQQSRNDLETAYEELQSSNEELETTNEELQSTVEELETTNEELQSTNEELETMNEELQSTNEELEAVNDELRQRGLQLNGANSFLEGILTSLTDGVAVVDTELRVKAWNRRAQDLWGVRADEVRDALLVNLDVGLSFDALLPAIRDCLAGRSEGAETVLAATNRRGRAISCRVTLSAMRGLPAPAQEAKPEITGVVILMEEMDVEA